MRLFAALPLSQEATDRLTRVRLRLSAPGDGLRWSVPEQWHITLQFYGEVEPEQASRLTHGLTKLNVGAAPEIRLAGLDRFAAKGILHASVEITPSLRNLHQEVERVGMQCGFAPEARPFRPHITLARSKSRSGIKTLQRLFTPEPPSFGPEVRWTAEELLLLQSTLRPQGAEYTVEARRSLSAAVSRDGAVS